MVHVQLLQATPVQPEQILLLLVLLLMEAEVAEVVGAELMVLRVEEVAISWELVVMQYMVHKVETVEMHQVKHNLDVVEAVVQVVLDMMVEEQVALMVKVGLD